jgi:hypothetical protein
MELEKIKAAVSRYLSSHDMDVLDMFYKIPCDSCKTIVSWGKFLLVPDMIILANKKKYLAFIIELKTMKGFLILRYI